VLRTVGRVVTGLVVDNANKTIDVTYTYNGQQLSLAVPTWRKANHLTPYPANYVADWVSRFSRPTGNTVVAAPTWVKNGTRLTKSGGVRPRLAPTISCTIGNYIVALFEFNISLDVGDRNAVGLDAVALERTERSADLPAASRRVRQGRGIHDGNLHHYDRRHGFVRIWTTRRVVRCCVRRYDRQHQYR
jgi:hypothetical protein